MMSKPTIEVGVLSVMNRELSEATKDALKGVSGGYVDRLNKVAQDTYLRGDWVSGTTISRPSIVMYGEKHRLRTEIMPPGFTMYVREIETPEGYLVMFPMHTIGMTKEGTPVINPSEDKGYTIAHLPAVELGSDLYNPAEMKADLIFTVDRDNLVTVNGMNPVTATEFTLFDDIVCEFERRAA